jgi:serine protease AprX
VLPIKRLLALAAGLLLLAAPLASAQDSNPGRKIDKALKESLRKGGRTQRVIITVAPGCRANMLGALRQHGDVIKSEHPLINALSAEAHSEDVEELAKHPCVTAVAADADVYADGAKPTVARGRKPRASTSTVQSAPATPNVLRETLGLPRVATSDANGSTGVGVVIIDSGIAPVADFTGRIVGFYDFTRGGVATRPFDDYGHGTHIAGLIGSSGRQSNYEFQGIAPAVNMIGLKVLDGTGQGKTSDVISAIEFAVANRARLNAHIMNISLGHPIYAPAKDDPLVQAVERASAAGYIVVVAAGNAGVLKKDGEPGYTGISSPGNARSAITVGAAMNHDTVPREGDLVAPYSSRGPTWFDAFAKPDVVAPGDRLLSDTSLTSYLFQKLPDKRGHAKNGQHLLRLSGTSMSAGVTSGVVALMLQKHNQSGIHPQKQPLSPNLVKAMLQFSAIPVAGADYLTQGAGQINAAGAMALAKYIDTGARPGEYWLTVGVEPYTTIGGHTHAWSQHVIWNDTVLTGDLLYYNLAPWSVGAADEDNIIWGTDDNIIWGTSALVDDDNIIWGTTSVWAANLVWGDRIIGLDDGDNIIWGTDDDNIIWGTLDFDNIIWGTWDGDNIIWGTWDGDNVIWGTDDGDNVIWGTNDDDNVIWGTNDDDNVIWGTLLVGRGPKVF